MSLAEIERWRQQGPLGKLHNIVVYIQASIQWEQKFWELSSGSRLTRDNDTRWNSWFSILTVAINLQEAIDEYCQEFKAELSVDHTDDILSNTDWETLTEIKGFLEKLLYSTKALESLESCIDLMLPNFEYILKIFETAKELNATNHIISPMVNSGWQKLQKYYELSDESHVYVTALILNPRRKWQWLDKKWSDQPTWLRDAKRKVQRL